MIEKKAVGLSLANGMKLELMPGDEPANYFLSHLIEIMQLEPIADPTLSVILRVDGEEPYPIYRKKPFEKSGTKKACILRETNLLKLIGDEEERTAICILNNCFCDEPFFKKMNYISSLISLVVLDWGCIFIHGGLVEKDHIGVILAGRSGVGKTTAVNRIPAPWTPLCDETTLIVKDGSGDYWAHPMPTRSRFMEEGPGGNWNVQHSVPLKSIFFLMQSDEEQIIPLNKINSTYLINQFAVQSVGSLFGWSDVKTRKAIFTQILINSSAIADTVQAYILKLSLNGTFWNDVDRILLENEKPIDQIQL
jgi:SynChlorMet cassette protein ScmC